MQLLRALLTDLVASGQCLGAQADIHTEGHDERSLTIGCDASGMQLHDRSLNAMYCCAKSLTSLILAKLVSDGDISFDDKVGDLVPCAGPVSMRTVSELASHVSGITRPTMLEATMLNAEDQFNLAVSDVGVDLDGTQSAYSEAAGFLLLGRCLEEAAGGVPIDELAVSLILEPLEVDQEFCLTGQSERIAISSVWRNGRFRPLLAERNGMLPYRSNPGFGGFASPRGLVALLREIMESLSGDSTLAISKEVAQELVQPGPTRWDLTFRRHCSFSNGFMTKLATHHLPSDLSDLAFGQAGFMGMTTMVCDPVLRLASVVTVNSYFDDGRLTRETRKRIWLSILEDHHRELLTRPDAEVGETAEVSRRARTGGGRPSPPPVGPG